MKKIILPIAVAKQAFTLMELMIVIVIIGILATVGMVMFGGQAEKAKRIATISNHNNLAKLMQLNIMKGLMGDKIYLTSNSTGATVEIYCCPINASTARSRYVTHLRWSGWRNPYEDKEEAAAENCNSKAGCIEIGARTEILPPDNLSHHTLKTYYKDENGDLQTLEEEIKVGHY